MFNIHPSTPGTLVMDNLNFENIGTFPGYPLINTGTSYNAELKAISFRDMYKNNILDEN